MMATRGEDIVAEAGTVEAATGTGGCWVVVEG